MHVITLNVQLGCANEEFVTSGRCRLLDRNKRCISKPELKGKYIVPVYYCRLPVYPTLFGIIKGSFQNSMCCLVVRIGFWLEMLQRPRQSELPGMPGNVDQPRYR